MHLLSLYTAGEQIMYVYLQSRQHKVDRTKTDRSQTIVISQLLKEESTRSYTRQR